MREGLVVITSCTATKLETADGEERTAESLYAGQQHLRLMRGVKAYRDGDQPVGALRLRILSAFHGLLPPKQKIAAYDHSFAGLPADAIRRQAKDKEVPSAIRRTLRKPFAAGLLLLGDPYLRACDLDQHMTLGGPVVCLCSPAVARRMPTIAGLRTIALTNAEAQRFSVPLIALKGELGGRVLTRLAQEPTEITQLTSSSSDVLGWLQAAAGNPRMRSEAA